MPVPPRSDRGPFPESTASISAAQPSYQYEAALEAAPEPASMSGEASTSQAQSRFGAEERRELMQIMLDLLDERER